MRCPRYDQALHRQRECVWPPLRSAWCMRDVKKSAWCAVHAHIGVIGMVRSRVWMTHAGMCPDARDADSTKTLVEGFCQRTLFSPDERLQRRLLRHPNASHSIALPSEFIVAKR